jgi:hypothetical protein
MSERTPNFAWGHAFMFPEQLQQLLLLGAQDQFLVCGLGGKYRSSISQVFGQVRKAGGRIAASRDGESDKSVNHYCCKGQPGGGELYPCLSSVWANDQATEARSRCRQLEIQGVTLAGIFTRGWNNL